MILNSTQADILVFDVLQETIDMYLFYTNSLQALEICIQHSWNDPDLQEKYQRNYAAILTGLQRFYKEQINKLDLNPQWLNYIIYSPIINIYSNKMSLAFIKGSVIDSEISGSTEEKRMLQ